MRHMLYFPSWVSKAEEKLIGKDPEHVDVGVAHSKLLYTRKSHQS